MGKGEGSRSESATRSDNEHSILGETDRDSLADQLAVGEKFGGRSRRGAAPLLGRIIDIAEIGSKERDTVRSRDRCIGC